MPYFGSLRLRSGGLADERTPGMGRATKVFVPSLFTLKFATKVFSLSNPSNLSYHGYPSHLSLTLSPRCHPVIGFFWLSFSHWEPQRGSWLTKTTGRQRDGCPRRRASHLDQLLYFLLDLREGTVSLRCTAIHNHNMDWRQSYMYTPSFPLLHLPCFLCSFQYLTVLVPNMALGRTLAIPNKFQEFPSKFSFSANLTLDLLFWQHKDLFTPSYS